MTIRSATAALAAACLLAGCSGDDADDRSQATAPTTVAESTTSTTVATTTSTTAPASLPALPADAAELGALLGDSERALRADPAPSGDELAAIALRQQHGYRVLAARPEADWRAAFAAAGDRRTTVEANTRAQAELYALTKPRTALPDWNIMPPAPADELLGHYREAERAVGVPWYYLAAINLSETRMGRIRGTSSAGAQGPMQFMPATWTQYGEGGDINDPRDAIFAAARLLKRNGAPADMANALFNYNRSQRYVRAVTAYAEEMRADERAYRAYHQWQVFYRLEGGDVMLPVGWPSVPEVR